MNETLSINLTSDISYVYGLVNGVEANFSLTSPGLWSAVVPKADNGKYVIEITAYNNVGSFTQYNTIVYRLDDLMQPKLDWGPDDYYNAEDVNKLEANTQYMLEFLKSIHYVFPDIIIKTDRTLESIEFLDSINRIEDNVEAIRHAFVTPIGWLPKEIWIVGKTFDYTDANRLENNIYILYVTAKLAKDSQIYCGTFSCGTDWEGELYG